MDRRLQLVVWPLAALLVAVLVGLAVGAWAAGLVEPLPYAEPADDEWTGVLFVVALVGLAEAPDLVGGVVGVLTGALVWTVGLLAGARRLLVPGRQGVPVLATLGTAFVGTAVVLLVWGAARGSQGPPSLATVTVVVAVIAVVACVAFPISARRGDRAGRPAEADTLEGEESVDALGGWLDRAAEQAPPRDR